eukprot:SAG11_NODE_25007_length_364_cov_5.716981_1_plen_48_part_10
MSAARLHTALVLATRSPPVNCEALISRLAVEVNGQTLVNLTNYNDLFH